MTELIDLLKIATGRKLSQKEMEMARREEKHSYPSMKDLDEFWIDGDYMVKKETRILNYHESKEASNPDVVRQNPSKTKTDTKYYNLDGLLVKRRITIDKINPFYSSHKVISYTPSGSFFGDVQSHSESFGGPH
jgi:hypothetical protein